MSFFIENIYNNNVYNETGRAVSDYSDGKLRRARRKLRSFENVYAAKADIMDLPYPTIISIVQLQVA